MTKKYNGSSKAVGAARAAPLLAKIILSLWRRARLSRSTCITLPIRAAPPFMGSLRPWVVASHSKCVLTLWLYSNVPNIPDSWITNYYNITFPFYYFDGCPSSLLRLDLTDIRYFPFL